MREAMSFKLFCDYGKVHEQKDHKPHLEQAPKWKYYIFKNPWQKRRLDGTQGFPPSIVFLTSLTYNFILETMNT